MAATRSRCSSAPSSSGRSARLRAMRSENKASSCGVTAWRESVIGRRPTSPDHILPAPAARRPPPAHPPTQQKTRRRAGRAPKRPRPGSPRCSPPAGRASRPLRALEALPAGGFLPAYYFLPTCVPERREGELLDRGTEVEAAALAGEAEMDVPLD